MAMGGSTIASVNDVTAAYWNPAGMVGKIDNRQIMLMHAEYFSRIANYDYGAMVSRIDHRSAMGITFLRLGVDDIPNTLNLIDPSGNINYANITSFSSADYGMLFSYGRQTKDETLKIGGTVKVIRRVVADFAGAWGFGIDLGVQKRFGKWNTGLVARDLTNTFNIWSFNTNLLADVFTATGNELNSRSIEITRPTLVAGIGTTREFKEYYSLTGEANFAITTDGNRNTLLHTSAISIDPTIGFDLGYRSKFFIRGGINNIQRETNLDDQRKLTLQPNLGAGVRIKNINIDYAITDIGGRSNSFYSNIISLKINFEPKQ